MTLIEKPDQAAPDPDTETPAGGHSCHPMFRTAPSSVQFNKLRKRLLRHTRQAIGRFRHGADRGDATAVVGCLVRWKGFLRPSGSPVGSAMAGSACRSTCWPAISTRGSRTFPSTFCQIFSMRRASSIASSTRTPIRSSPTRCRKAIPIAHSVSRLRRGHLYRIAREEGCQALVLGHHREDILETFFMKPLPWRDGWPPCRQSSSTMKATCWCCDRFPIAPRTTWRNSPTLCGFRLSLAICAGHRTACSVMP